MTQPDERPLARLSLAGRMGAHAATWLAWPHNPQYLARQVRADPGRLPTLCARWPGSSRCIFWPAARMMAEARELVGELPNVTLHDIRDQRRLVPRSRPDVSGRPAGMPAALVDWEYNAWGGKYPPFDQDNGVPDRSPRLGRRRFQPGIILEGGAIEGNGRGRC